MKTPLMLSVLVGLYVLPVLASEEALVPIEECRMVLTGKRADLEEIHGSFAFKPATKRLTAAALEIGGKKVEVPAAAFSEHPEIQPESGRLSTEPGYEAKPWFYLSFSLKGETGTRFYLAFQDGKYVKSFTHPKSPGVGAAE